MLKDAERQLRVAVITDYFPTSVQPWAGHSAYQTLLELSRKCTVEVFYPESVYPAILTPKSRTYASLDRTHAVPGIPTHYLPFRALPLVTRPINGWLAARAVKKKVKAFRPDVILSYIVYPDGFAAVRVGKSLRVPAVLTAIGSDLNRIPGVLVRQLTRYALKNAGAVFTVSSDLLHTARRLGAPERRSMAILNGCDTAKFRPRDRSAARLALNVPQGQEVVLYVGRLDVRKGLNELVEAVAVLRRDRPAVHLYIVGEGADRVILNAAVARCHLEADTTFVPSCTTDRVALWMAAADLVTLPSYKEGCPNVILEALASGRPVVATNVGGIPELMDGSSGRLIPPNDVPSLTVALDEVLSARWDADELANRHERSWSDVSDDVFGLLKNVLQRRF